MSVSKSTNFSARDERPQLINYKGLHVDALFTKPFNRCMIVFESFIQLFSFKIIIIVTYAQAKKSSELGQKTYLCLRTSTLLLYYLFYLKPDY